MKWLVTGGCGFIGTNLVAHLVRQGHKVVILDDLSRAGVDSNQRLLEAKFGVAPEVIDVANSAAVWDLFVREGPFDAVAHLAGQVSYLASIQDPVRDFEVNATGTMNVLESVRRLCPGAAVIAMSSNKIYGNLDWVNYVETDKRYEAVGYDFGFDEDVPLQMSGPYGVSKGVVDQYVGDYGRTFGLRTASLRQSSVYGPFQHPRSDQGWVAHLVGEAVLGNEISLNGVGKQVRDLIHVTDLVRLIVRISDLVPPGAGWQVNVGGGPTNALSILELFDWLEIQQGVEVRFQTGPTRHNDQKVFISNNSRVTELTGWSPAVSLHEGLSALVGEIRDNQS